MGGHNRAAVNDDFICFHLLTYSSDFACVTVDGNAMHFSRGLFDFKEVAEFLLYVAFPNG